MLQFTPIIKNSRLGYWFKINLSLSKSIVTLFAPQDHNLDILCSPRSFVLKCISSACSSQFFHNFRGEIVNLTKVHAPEWKTHRWYHGEVGPSYLAGDTRSTGLIGFHLWLSLGGPTFKTVDKLFAIPWRFFLCWSCSNVHNCRYRIGIVNSINNSNSY